MVDNAERKFASNVEELDFLLRRVSSTVKRRGRDILADFKITTPQFNALLVLRREGDLTIGELGERLFLACSTATDLVDRMERNELVLRIRDTRDRRVIRMKVLDKGHQMVKEVLEARATYLNGVLSQISDEECTEIIKSMNMLYRLMSE